MMYFMGKVSKVDAIVSLKPTAKFHVVGNETIHWHEDSPVTQPSDTAIANEVTRLQAEYDALEYQRKRQEEYPPMADYLDAVVKGDETQKQKYIDDCKAVKEKYPK